MKHLIVILVLLALSVGLASCGQDDTPSDKLEYDTKTQPSESGSEQAQEPTWLDGVSPTKPPAANNGFQVVSWLVQRAVNQRLIVASDPFSYQATGRLLAYCQGDRGTVEAQLLTEKNEQLGRVRIDCSQTADKPAVKLIDGYDKPVRLGVVADENTNWLVVFEQDVR